MPATPARTTLLLFTRYPRAGEVKTRLIPALGPEGAATFHDRLVHHTLSEVRHWIHAAPGRTGLVCLDGASDSQAQAWLPNTPCEPQSTGDLGHRLRSAITAAFTAGAKTLLVIGSDCPRATADDFAAAQDALTNADVVLGPAADGGYWLIGLKSPHRQLFDNIPWGGPRVLVTTMAHARSLHLTTKLLRTLPDVDLPEDLPDACTALGIPLPPQPAVSRLPTSHS